MKKNLLLLVCLCCLPIIAFSQDNSSTGGVDMKTLVQEVEKWIFKDPKIELIEVDDIVSSVETENENNISKFQNKIENDTLAKTIANAQDKKLNEKFETPFKEAGAHPEETFSNEDFLDNEELQNFKNNSNGELSSINQDDITKMPEETPSLKELPLIPGSTIKTKYMSKIDSMRKLNISEEKIKLSETVKEKSKVVVLKEKQTLKEKMYFEGVIGVLSDNIKMVQISPALGYQMLKKYSMGIGPDIQLNQESKQKFSSIGVRSFGKYEMIKRKIYLQLENVSVRRKDIKDGVSEEGIKQKILNHSLSLGGGYLVQLNNSTSLNLAIMCRLNKVDTAFEDVSPLSFRLGVSTFGNSKRKK